MECTWNTPGIPMACPMCTADCPCHFSEQREVTMPLDMPLTISTNIEYELDEDKFPGLNSYNQELTLMMAPVSVAVPQTSTQCPAQTLVSTPLPSEDMQSSSGYVSEEDIFWLVEQGLDTSGIVSLIDSFTETTDVDSLCSLSPQESTRGHHMPGSFRDTLSEQRHPTAVGDTLHDFLNSICKSDLNCQNSFWNQCEDFSDSFLSSSASRDFCGSSDQVCSQSPEMHWMAQCTSIYGGSEDSSFGYPGQFNTDWASLDSNPILV